MRMSADLLENWRVLLSACLAAVFMALLLTGCGLSPRAKWKRSLVVPDKAPTSVTEREVTYRYKCPPGYHIIPCPTCTRTLYRSERRCRREFDFEKMRKVQKCEEVNIPTGSESFPCAYCMGNPHICEPDSYDHGKKAGSGKP
jgi:hypothetical protein